MAPPDSKAPDSTPPDSDDALWDSDPPPASEPPEEEAPPEAEASADDAIDSAARRADKVVATAEDDADDPDADDSDDDADDADEDGDEDESIDSDEDDDSIDSDGDDDDDDSVDSGAENADADDDADDDDDDADDDDADDDDADDDDGDLDDEENERAIAARRALGVDRDDAAGDDELDEKAALAAAKAPKNRAERRRRAAKRRRRKGAASTSDVADDDAEGSGDDDEEGTEKDRNRRKRAQLLRRRRRAAQASDEDEEDDDDQRGLDAEEKVADAFARGSDASFKWVRDNWSVLQWVILAAIVAGGVGLYLSYRTEEKVSAGSAELGRALLAEGAIVQDPKDDKRTDEQKKATKGRYYPSASAKAEAVYAAYEAAAAKAPTPAAKALVDLGKANQLLRDRKWADAKAIFATVASSPLATRDADVKTRAIEGQLFADEGNKKVDDALARAKELQALDRVTSKLLGQYHEARLLWAKDPKANKAAVQKLLEDVKKGVQGAELDSRSRKEATSTGWLKRASEGLLGEVDPSSVKKKDLPGGLDPEMLKFGLPQK